MSLLLVLCTMLPEVIRLPSPAITDIFTLEALSRWEE